MFICVSVINNYTHVSICYDINNNNNLLLGLICVYDFSLHFIGRFLNHSCNPNLDIITVFSDSHNAQVCLFLYILFYFVIRLNLI